MSKLNILQKLQGIGRSLMIPIAMLPAAGILLAFGTSLQDPNVVAQIPFLGTAWLVHILTLLSEAGGIIFANLPLLFAVGVAVGLSNDQGIAGLSAIVGFLIMNVTIGQYLGITADAVANNHDYTLALGIPSLQTGVFGGIVIGIISSVLYKRYFTINLPSWLEFFSGKRFVPIITSFAAVFVGIAMALIWPPIQHAINGLSNSMMNSGLGLSAFLFGFIERLLIPFGLNHVWWPTFWLQFGEYVNKAGQAVHGDQLIFFAQLKDQVPITAGAFMAGLTPLKMFCIPAVALAIYRCANEENKSRVKGIMLSGAITSIVCGITEPIEFSFLFVAPVLFGIHAVLAGVVFLLMELLSVHIGLSFSGGLIDYIFFGILPRGHNWYMVFPVGILMGSIYYLLFTLAIKRWNLLTPGREKPEVGDDKVSSSQSDDLITGIIIAYGGLDNMRSIEACMSRLRIDVIDKSIIDKNTLKRLGAAGIVEVGNNIQSVFGMKSDRLKESIRAVKNQQENSVSGIVNY
ncbi:glucose-specific PTS transporter subunit IIBC [Erwinia typographi]|uniref:glucose-specific PTS transporter subunit IIBC n=1 Tax=Erwinia typographi TaxID=371042 RepID=UPI00068F72C0|nr:glucose-specific PTS transporter subunit IIBC [Erwinia typographi]